MTAILQTLCGCMREIEMLRPLPTIKVPIQRKGRGNFWVDEGAPVIEERTFELERSDDPYYYYREV